MFYGHAKYVNIKAWRGYQSFLKIHRCFILLKNSSASAGLFNRINFM